MQQANMDIWQECFSADNTTESWKNSSLKFFEEMFQKECEETGQITTIRDAIAKKQQTRELTAEEELSLEAQTIEDQLEMEAQKREDEGYRWGER